MFAYYLAVAAAIVLMFVVRSAGDFRTTSSKALVVLTLGWLFVIAMVGLGSALTGGIDGGAVIMLLATAAMSVLMIIQMPHGTLKPRPKCVPEVAGKEAFSADILGGALGYRAGMWSSDSAVWHTSPSVRTHKDIIRRQDGRSLFVRQYTDYKIFSAMGIVKGQAHWQMRAAMMPVAGDTSIYLARVLESSPEDCARIARSLDFAKLQCHAVLPTTPLQLSKYYSPGKWAPPACAWGRDASPEACAIALSSQWVFPALRVHSSPLQETRLDNLWCNYYVFKYELRYEPRVLELAEALCGEFHGAALVCPTRTPTDRFRSSGQPKAQALVSPGAVAALVSETMVQLPFIGFVVDESVADEIAAAGDIGQLLDRLDAVRALVVGIFDGESFAVYSV